MKKIIAIAVHPDDETLMCGGTLLKHKFNGDQIFWLIVTSISTNFGWDKETVDKRQKEIMEVANLYDFNKIFQLDFPTTKLDEIPRGNIIAAIATVFNEVKPDIVYLPNRSDIHSDHQITFQAAYSCTKHFRFPFIQKVLMGETLSETEFAPGLSDSTFIPNVFIDISDYLDKKNEIMNIYASEIMSETYPRSIETMEALAKYRGSRISVKYAESFMLLYEIS
jgi:LmbE family N-acetylglucosaminyl deacetylase